MRSEYKTNRCKHRETPKVRGSPQTQGYVHQSVASCKLFSKRLVTIQDNSVACTSMVYIARTPHGVFFYPYHWVQWTAFPKHKDTSQYLYLCSKHQDNHSPLSLRQKAVFISMLKIIKYLWSLTTNKLQSMSILLKTIPSLCLLSLRHINSETIRSLRFILNKTNRSLYDQYQQGNFQSMFILKASYLRSLTANKLQSCLFFLRQFPV